MLSIHQQRVVHAVFIFLVICANIVADTYAFDMISSKIADGIVIITSFSLFFFWSVSVALIGRSINKILKTL